MAMGMMPATVEKAVMRMGRSRTLPASIMAVTGSMPCWARWLAYSTNKMEFLVTSPMRSTSPIWLNKLMFMDGITGMTPT